jgi:acyl transferase domain-containing protein
MTEHAKRPDIAIIGASALFPGSVHATGFWQDILSSKDLIDDVPASHWLHEDYFDADPKSPDKTYAKRGAFLGDVDFDALGWGIPPSILEATDTSQLLALIVAQKVLEDASSGAFEAMDKSRMSCILGVTGAQELLGTMVSRLQHPVWRKALREHGLPEDEVEEVCKRISDSYVPWQEATFPGLLGNVVAGRIANRLDLGGTNCVTDAACASTFSALQMGMNELYMGDSDVVIAGGVDTMNDIFMYMCFSKTPALSATGDVRPFSDQADGTMLGEGLAMFALKRLEDAERDGDKVWAVIHGVGSSSDGRAKSVYAPRPEGQAKAIRRAYDIAGYGADTIELVEAHGTGTKAGDAAEFAGLRMVFNETGRADRQWCALGSVKSQIGHTKASAGAAGLFKAVMALRHKTLPPTIKIDRPNPGLKLDESAFYLSTRVRPWVRGADHPRRAGVSSFGFGGSNFHVSVEEYKGANSKTRLNSMGSWLVLLTGKDAGDIAAQARAHVANADMPEFLTWLSHSSTAAFNAAAPARLAVVATDAADLKRKLEKAAARLVKAPTKTFETPDGTSFGLGAAEGKVAFVFPGQGSQRVDMSADVAIHSDAAIAPWDMAASMNLDADLSLQEVVFPRPVFTDEDRAAQQTRLTRTEWAQPAIGCASLSYLALAKQVGLTPAAVAGHSYGEVTALHAAGAYDDATMLRIARRRGELMAEAAKGDGAMTAVASKAEAVLAALADSGVADVVLANHNHPTQVILSGPTSAVEAAEKALGARDMMCRRLPVATAFHSSVVASAEAPFRAFLNEIDAKIPADGPTVYANTSAAPYDGDWRDTLSGQVTRPVRWVELVERMHADGVRHFIEVGPGSVLTGLIGRTLRKQPHTAVSFDRKGKDGWQSLLVGIGRLSASGVVQTPGALLADHDVPVNPSDVPKPKLSIAINGSNHAKPYPPQGGAAALPKPNPKRAAVAPIAAQEVAPMTTKPTHSAATHSASTHTAPAPQPTAAPAPQAPPQQHYAAPQAIPGYDPSRAAWIQAYQEAQRQAAQAHSAFQQAMADSHQAFLRTAETGFVGLATMVGGQTLAPPAFAAPQPAYVAPAPAYVAPAPAYVAPAPAYVAPAPVYAPQPVAAAPQPVAAAPQPVVAAPAPVVAIAAAPVVAAAAAAPAMDLAALLLEVVADKTGYPADMLSMEMDLEGDLGVDSIKRVEILSAMQEKAPGLPEVDPGAMAALRTLGQIVDALGGATGTDTAAAAAPATTGSAPTEKASPPIGEIDLSGLLLQVVADKTGYPADMLNMEMDLEGDLGVDSIKRVEILSAMQEQAPDLPEVDPGAMASLRTLGQIVDALGTGGPADAVPFADGSAGQLPADPSSTASNTAAAASTPVMPDNLGRFVLELVQAPPSGMVRAGLAGDTPLLILDGGSHVGAALAAELNAHGVASEVVDELPEDATAVVFLGGLSEFDSVAAACSTNHAAFAAARVVAQAPRAFVTVQDTGGKFGLSPELDEVRAWSGGLTALARTAAIEWPGAAIKSVDLQRADRTPVELARALADELLHGGHEIEVGLTADGNRWTLADRKQAPALGKMDINENDVIVVSGGARGVTAATVIALADASHARFVLLGRTPLTDEPEAARGVEGDAGLKRALLLAARAAGEMPKPAVLGKTVSRILANREINGTLAAIHQAGGRARYEAADVSDAAAISSTLDRVRADWGPITGIIHGAGVIADKPIARKSVEDFAWVFDTKVNGLRNLLSATAGDPIDLLVFFSSVAARCGNNGQADYAMANEVLNKVAEAERRRRGGLCLVKSLGWGPWEGGMVSPQLKAHFEQLGVPLIPLDIGAHMLVSEVMGSSPEQVELVMGGAPRPEALLPTGDGRKATFAINVGPDTHPWLTDHAIDGTPVVPVVLVLEWFARAASALRPDLHAATVEDLKVLGGLPLKAWPAETRFHVQVVEIANGVGSNIQAILTDATGRRRYSAHVRLTDARPTARPWTGQAPSLADWGDKDVYGDVLFHGPELRVIRMVEGSSSDGIAAALDGVAGTSWRGGPWATDVAAFDGGLQLALLWGRDVLGGPSLPTGIGKVRLFTDAPVTGPLRGVLTGRLANRGKAVSDIAFIDSDGRLVAELAGVETHALPGRTPN